MVYFDCRNITAGTTGAECQKSCHTLDMQCVSTARLGETGLPGTACALGAKVIGLFALLQTCNTEILLVGQKPKAVLRGINNGEQENKMSRKSPSPLRPPPLYRV